MSAARAEYAQRQTEVHLLVERLSKGLKQHGKAASRQSNWCHVGDLNACKGHLLEALAMLGGLTEEEMKSRR